MKCAHCGTKIGNPDFSIGPHYCFCGFIQRDAEGNGKWFMPDWWCEPLCLGNWLHWCLRHSGIESLAIWLKLLDKRTCRCSQRRLAMNAVGAYARRWLAWLWHQLRLW